MTRLLALLTVLGVTVFAGSALAGNGPPHVGFYVDGTAYRTVGTPTDLSGTGAQDAYCSGYAPYNSFHGHGLVDALAAVTE